jgi:hypothetical protein
MLSLCLYGENNKPYNQDYFSLTLHYLASQSNHKPEL